MEQAVLESIRNIVDLVSQNPVIILLICVLLFMLAAVLIVMLIKSETRKHDLAKQVSKAQKEQVQIMNQSEEERRLRQLAEYERSEMQSRLLAGLRWERPDDKKEGPPCFDEINARNINRVLCKAAQVEMVRLDPSTVPPLKSISVTEAVAGTVVGGLYHLLYKDGSRGPENYIEEDEQKNYIKGWKYEALGPDNRRISSYVVQCGNGLTCIEGVNIAFEPDKEQPEFFMPLSAEQVILHSQSPITIEMGGRLVDIPGSKHGIAIEIDGGTMKKINDEIKGGKIQVRRHSDEDEEKKGESIANVETTDQAEKS